MNASKSSRTQVQHETESTGNARATARGQGAEQAGGSVAWIADSPRVVAQRQRLQSLASAEGGSPAGTAAPNLTGLPDQLKTGIESLSGMSLDHVRVHRDSEKPARLQALAYTQGSSIHLGPGQEHHLPHEAWHVVQQAKGRVRPTMRTNDGVAINDDGGLEHEATVMGGRALQFASTAATMKSDRPHEPRHIAQQAQAPVQRVGISSLLKWGGAGIAGASLAGIIAAGSVPLGLGLGLLGGSAMLMGGMALGKKRSTGYGTRPRTGVPTANWYEDRADTAYGHTTGLGTQGPHTVPHVGKRVATENASTVNPNFDPVAISTRTGVIPSAGQARRIVRDYETNTGSTIPDANKRKLDQEYKAALARRNTGTHAERVAATRDAMEMSPLSTYSLHKKATHDEIKAKGERRHNVQPDLDLMGKMKKGSPMPTFAKVDLPSTPAHNPAYMHKMFRDTGQIYKGNDDLSEFELSSDDEY